jgi:DNA mismatch endonuclease, patch repair protein
VIAASFWHGHPKRWKTGRYGRYWDDKIARNVERDRQVDEQLRSQGCRVIRLWDFEMRKDLRSAVAQIERALAAEGRDASVRVSPGSGGHEALSE